MYYTYILYSKKLNRFYIGSTSNLQSRLEAHNSGTVPYTKMGTPWKLVYYEAFVEKSDAIREERFLKTGKGRDRRKYLLKSYLEKRN
ncbi:MAG: GIY-YIG nuclease family protein [Candidatus Dojkabacteria bacterium]|nr:GIY-YIG nuclease family protein [Candidatus Dojkabacteria bacterium]